MSDIVLLNCNGVIRKSRNPDHDYINTVDDIELLPEALRTIAASPKSIYAGIHNAGGVEARIDWGDTPFQTLEQAIAIERQTLTLIPNLRRVYLCPQYSKERSYGTKCVKVQKNTRGRGFSFSESTYRGNEFRLPGLSMLALAIKELGSFAKDVTYVGDTETDWGAADVLGIKFVWANEWYIT